MNKFFTTKINDKKYYNGTNEFSWIYEDVFSFSLTKKSLSLENSSSLSPDTKEYADQDFSKKKKKSDNKGRWGEALTLISSIPIDRIKRAQNSTANTGEPRTFPDSPPTLRK